MANDLAANIIGIAAFVFVSSTLLLGHLLPYAEDLLPDEDISEYREAAFFAVGFGFILANFGVALVSTSLTDRLGPEIGILPEGVPLFIGAMLLVGAVSAPSVGAAFVASRLYSNERDERLIIEVWRLLTSRTSGSSQQTLDEAAESDD